MAGAIRSAGASLTADARRRLETSGPLVAARRTRQAALVEIEAAYERALLAAARDYSPAAEALLSAVDDAMVRVRTELEIYEAVITVAEEALDSRRSSASGSAREARASASEHDAAVATRDRADGELAAARSALDRVRRREPEYRGPGVVAGVLSGLTAGLAEAAGDSARARQIQEDQASETNQALDSYNSSVAAWEAEVAEAEARVEAARESANRASDRAASAGARRESASRSTSAASNAQIEALAARQAARLDAAMVTTVLDRAEFASLAAVLKNTAMAVIGELETDALDGVTGDAAEVALHAALERYGDLLPAALDAAREAIDAEGPKRVAAERARLERQHQSQLLAEGRRRARDLDAAVGRAEAGYRQALDRADQTLQAALAVFLDLGPNKRKRTRNQQTLQAALARHASATEAARTKRSNAIVGSAYSVASLVGVVSRELDAALPADAVATAVAAALAQGDDVGGVFAEHRERGQHLDAAFRAVILGEYRAKTEAAIPERVEQLVAREIADVEKELAAKAETARKQLVDRIPQLVDRAAALRALEEDVREGLFRAAGSRY